MKRAIFLSVMLFFAVSFGFAEEEVQEVAVIARRWEFFPSTITVRKDVPVKIHITTVDVPHGFSLPDFSQGSWVVSSDKLKKGEIVTFTYTFPDAGEFTYACNVFCGTGHTEMKGKIIVEE